ncbi:ATP-dependent nuclease [Streptococcus sp. P25B114]|nr:AAA family ATPase [Streptococcus suis]HEM2721244.1 AAA family ATPase [Streptococcus suis]HEM5296700.1 AAA family ATPase [Streptococcus suis]
MSDIKELLDRLTNMFKSKHIFYPYIEHIRFPKYKALEKDSRINFTYPITLLVGQNGSNKTSILQALYGSPEGNSVSDYWFSTEVDRIDEKGKHCLIYGYYQKEAGKIVEILKGRSGTAKGNDYWEPYAPQKQYGMEKLKDGEYLKFGSSSKSRWDVLKKNVVYCDCKEYVSAFDLFFYHYNFESTKSQRTKQDFIRRRSKPLAKVLQNGDTEYSYYKKEMVDTNLSIDSNVCTTVSEIMGETYSEIKMLTHNFYNKSSGNKPSKTIWIQKNGKEYSEAFAGTGEARLILLVNDILNAPEKSLVLIDEPEISLHPSAIYRFKKFILEQAIAKKHQIVITTHSTQLVKDFPKEAIKLVSKFGDKIRIDENIDYQNAFFELGEDYKDKKLIYVEDRLAQATVEYVIEHESNENIKNNVRVMQLPGGAEQMVKNHIVPSAIEEQQNKYYWLDGDKRRSYDEGKVEFIKSHFLENGKVVSKNIPESEYKNLDKIINELSIASYIKIDVSGNQGNKNEEELVKKQKQFIDYWARYVEFLPCKTPEEALARLDISKNGTSYDFVKDPNGKEYFKKKAEEEYNTSVNSDTIFAEQRRALGKLTKSDDLYIDIKKMLEALFLD